MKRKSLSLTKHIAFHRLLTGVMITVMSLVLVLFGLAAGSVAESRIRDNIRTNTAVVMAEYQSSVERTMTAMYEGFRSVEGNYQVLDLRSADLQKGYTPNPVRYMNLWTQCKQLLQANDTIVGHVYLDFFDGQMTISTYDQNPLRIRYDFSEWRERFPENRYYWVDAASCRDLVPDESVGAVLFRLYGPEERGSHGLLLMTIRADYLQSALTVNGLYEGSLMAFLTEGTVIAYDEGAGREFLEENREELFSRSEEEGGTIGPYYLRSASLSPTRWKFVYLVPEREVSGVRHILRDMVMLLIVTVGVSAALAVYISRRLSRPLQTLTDQVRSREVLDTPISAGGYSEVEVLGEALESMRLRIQHLLEQVQLEEEDKRRIEIALMQEQINPHFLYNTLNAILQLCEMGESREAGRMTAALSSFYRIGLSGGRDIITVAEELDHVRNYLLIQHYRYPDLFDYNIDCEPEVLPCRIPKMTLQPLVENALYHGIRPAGRRGNIAILGGSYNGRDAFLEVHDDGAGMEEEQIGNLCGMLEKATGRHVGLFNVNQRLRYTFGEDAGLAITSEPGDTCVRVRFRMETEPEKVPEGREEP